MLALQVELCSPRLLTSHAGRVGGPWASAGVLASRASPTSLLPGRGAVRTRAVPWKNVIRLHPLALSRLAVAPFGARFRLYCSVGVVRFELTTSRPPAGRANQAALHPENADQLLTYRPARLRFPLT